ITVTLPASRFPLPAPASAAASQVSFSIATTRAPRSRSCRVRSPRPGPISTTVSPGNIARASAILPRSRRPTGNAGRGSFWASRPEKHDGAVVGGVGAFRKRVELRRHGIEDVQRGTSAHPAHVAEDALLAEAHAAERGRVRDSVGEEAEGVGTLGPGLLRIRGAPDPQTE